MSTTPATRGSRIVRSRVPWLTDLSLVGASGLCAGLLWLVVAQLGKVSLVVPIGDEPRPVTLPAVLGAAMIGSLVGIVALRLLERFTTKALMTWVVLACVFTLFSLIAPLGATTAAAIGTLMAMHLLVAAITVVGAVRARRVFGEAS
ncbi:DUF6069 family protein [Aestuariimicrobium soli]|uniref:DUF6069 family protein n=1 Tax=Aestuariimicrobium soli TaxID=2035834 RepID=UPI003EBAB0B2